MTPRAARRWPGMAFLLSLVLVNPYVRGDGNGYYAWLVSPAIDGDFDFENQYRHADPIFRSLMFDADGVARESMKTSTGRLANQWSVGPAVLWSPWFAVAHAAVRVAQLWNPALSADGYSWPYRYVCAIGTAVYGWLALLLAWRAAELAGFTLGAPIAVAMVWTATPLPVYQYFLPFHVPALEAFGASLFVWGWLSLRPFARASQWAAWGAMAGLMTEIYQLTGILLLIAGYELIVVIRRDGTRRGLVSAAMFGLAGLIVWLPQLVGKAVVYGTPLTTGYHDQFFWTQPRLLQTAFSAEHGLFSWTPVAVFAAAGLIVGARTRPTFRVLLAASAVFFYAVASYQNWHGRSSFGNRFFVGLTAFGVIGLASLWSAAGPARPIVRRLGVAVALVLALWNAGLAIQWGTGIIPNQGPVDFREVARNQVTLVPAEAIRFLGLYFSSRDEASRRSEERGR